MKRRQNTLSKKNISLRTKQEIQEKPLNYSTDSPHVEGTFIIAIHVSQR